MSEAPAQHDPLPDLSPAAMRAVLGVPEPDHDPYELAPGAYRVETCGTFEMWVLTKGGASRYGNGGRAVPVSRSCDTWECSVCAPIRLARYREQVEEAAVSGVGVFAGADSIYLTVSHVADHDRLKKQRKRSGGEWITVPEDEGLRYTFSERPLTGRTVVGRQWLLSSEDARTALLALLTPWTIHLARKPSARPIVIPARPPEKRRNLPGPWHLHDEDRPSADAVKMAYCPKPHRDEVWRIVGERTMTLYGFRWTKGEPIPAEMKERDRREELARLWASTIAKVTTATA